MQAETLTTRCPHCQGPLALQRAAPGCDEQLRVACLACGAASRSSGDPIEMLRIDPPTPARAPALAG